MDVMNAAALLIKLANADESEQHDGMTNMKLNKLLYLAQVDSLQQYGRPLFDDDVEAWQDGPVVPQVYRKFKEYGRGDIPDAAQSFDLDACSYEDLEVLTDIYGLFGQNYTAKGLMRLIHRQGSSWSDTYRDGERHNVISRDLMRNDAEFKRTYDEELKELFDAVPSVKYDAEGHPIWPAEWGDLLDD